MGILDQFVSARLLDRYPQLYTLGQTNQFFRLHTFVSWIANAVYHSLLLYVFGELLWPYDGIQGDGEVAGHWVWGTAMYGAVLLTVLGKAGLITNNWTKYHVIAIPGSMALFLGFIAAYATVAPLVNVSTEYHGLVPKLFTSPIFWLQMLVLPVLCLARDVAYKYGKRMYKPQTYHHIQEIQKYNIQDYRPRYVFIKSFSRLCLFFANTSVALQYGAIPESHPQGPSSPAHAQTARIRLFAGRRVTDSRTSSVRHNTNPWALRRDGQLETTTAARTTRLAVKKKRKRAQGHLSGRC